MKQCLSTLRQFFFYFIFFKYTHRCEDTAVYGTPALPTELKGVPALGQLYLLPIDINKNDKLFNFLLVWEKCCESSAQESYFLFKFLHLCQKLLCNQETVSAD